MRQRGGFVAMRAPGVQCPALGWVGCFDAGAGAVQQAARHVAAGVREELRLLLTTTMEGWCDRSLDDFLADVAAWKGN
jgi:hypothetical protein